MQSISSTLIDSWERFYRANFVNSLTGFKSVNLIGTVNQQGVTNLGVFSSVVHIGSNPPLVGYINRPETDSLHTLSNIRSQGYYTINHIHPSFLEKAHQTSAKYPANISEFEAVGLTPEFAEGVAVPFVKESSVKYLLALEDIIPIPANGTSLVIGRIQQILLQEGIVSKDGYIKLDSAASVCSNGLDGYYTTSLIQRFKYAKHDTVTTKLKE